jgi:hypothetical protein
MTQNHKTFKDLKESKDLHRSWRDNREGKKTEQEHGGQRNLVREWQEEERKEEKEE